MAKSKVQTYKDIRPERPEHIENFPHDWTFHSVHTITRTERAGVVTYTCGTCGVIVKVPQESDLHFAFHSEETDA